MPSSKEHQFLQESKMHDHTIQLSNITLLPAKPGNSTSKWLLTLMQSSGAQVVNWLPDQTPKSNSLAKDKGLAENITCTSMYG